MPIINSTDVLNRVPSYVSVTLKKTHTAYELPKIVLEKFDAPPLIHLRCDSVGGCVIVVMSTSFSAAP